MNTGSRAVSDLPERDRVRNRLAASFVVEAGAGTGKTSLLVDRLLGLIAPPPEGDSPGAQFEIGRLVGITFTEKAAAELRDRLRRELEKSVGREYAALLELLRALRSRVMAEVPVPERPRVFSAMVNSAALDLLRAGRRRDARRLLEGFIHHKGTKDTKLTKNTQ